MSFTEKQIIDHLVMNALSISQTGILLTYSEPQKDVPYTKTFPLCLLEKNCLKVKRSNGKIEEWNVMFYNQIGLLFDYQPNTPYGFGMWHDDIQDYRIIVGTKVQHKHVRLVDLLDLNQMDHSILEKANELNAKAKEIYDSKLGR